MNMHAYGCKRAQKIYFGNKQELFKEKSAANPN